MDPCGLISNKDDDDDDDKGTPRWETIWAKANSPETKDSADLLQRAPVVTEASHNTRRLRWSWLRDIMWPTTHGLAEQQHCPDVVGVQWMRSVHADSA